ncbi:MAG TPA: hypothetical protein VE953_15425 [Terriglobales bacterium]|nr:hypothetical protein [Terriglobales bacterium]
MIGAQRPPTPDQAPERTHAAPGPMPRHVVESVERLAHAIRRRRSAQPFFIELAGTPRAGKTTALKSLAALLQNCDVIVKTVDESAHRCPIPDKRHPAFNLWTCRTTVHEILEAQRGDGRVVLIDRGVADAECWFDWHETRLDSPARVDRTTLNLTSLAPRVPAMDLVLVMETDPAVAMQRDGNGSAGSKAGQIMNPVTLAELNASIDRTVKRYEALLPLERLDTTHLTEHEVVSQLIDRALKHC